MSHEVRRMVEESLADPSEADEADDDAPEYLTVEVEGRDFRVRLPDADRETLALEAQESQRSPADTIQDWIRRGLIGESVAGATTAPARGPGRPRKHCCGPDLPPGTPHPTYYGVTAATNGRWKARKYAGGGIFTKDWEAAMAVDIETRRRYANADVRDPDPFVQFFCKLVKGPLNFSKDNTVVGDTRGGISTWRLPEEPDLLCFLSVMVGDMMNQLGRGKVSYGHLHTLINTRLRVEKYIETAINTGSRTVRPKPDLWRAWVSAATQHYDRVGWPQTPLHPVRLNPPRGWDTWEAWMREFAGEDESNRVADSPGDNTH
ncbi:MAG: hypothetical protein JSV86_10505 [Gemmatimonadota bacterium]|nr:MAG: hypothetical protein JSV86_10505 [Gemmatimonadota bacterium]